MGIVPGTLHSLSSSVLISLVAALFLHEVDNFQSEINVCLCALWVLQSWLRGLFEVGPEFAVSFLSPPHLVLRDSNCLGVS